MKRILISCFLLLAAILFVSAQNNFKPGYIITNDQDTLYGLINRTNSAKNSRICVFKKDEKSASVTYTPDEIKSYRIIGDKFFVSKEIKTNDVTQKLFVEYLINGIIDVYTCTYPDRQMRFFVEKDGSGNLIELTNDDREFIYDNTEYRRNIDKYTGILKILMADAPTLGNEIENASFNRESLIKVSEDYHNLVCSNYKCIIYEKRLPPSLVELGPVVGCFYTDVCQKTVHRDPYIIFNDDFKPAFTPAGGIYLKLFIPGLNHTLYIRDEFFVMHRVIKSDYLYYTDWTKKRDFTIKSNEFLNSLSLGASLTNWKLRPIINIGGFIRFPISTDNIGFEEYHLKLGKDYPLDNCKSLGITTGTGVGIKLKSGKYIDVLAQYSRGFNLLSEYNYNECTIKISFPVIK
jgi:hypothetical protein